MGRAGEHRLQAPIACTFRPRSLSVELTWPEDGEDNDDAVDEEEEDAMTEAKDEADVGDASSSACGVTSEWRRNTCVSEFDSRFNSLHMMVKELTFRFFLSILLALLLGTIEPKEKRELHGLESLLALHA